MPSEQLYLHAKQNVHMSSVTKEKVSSKSIILKDGVKVHGSRRSRSSRLVWPLRSESNEEGDGRVSAYRGNSSVDLEEVAALGNAVTSERLASSSREAALTDVALGFFGLL